MPVLLLITLWSLTRGGRRGGALRIALLTLRFLLSQWVSSALIMADLQQ